MGIALSELTIKEPLLLEMEFQPRRKAQGKFLAPCVMAGPQGTGGPMYV